MSESDGTVEGIAIEMLTQLQGLRKLVANQTETLCGIQALLTSHGNCLKMHQAVIERVAAELGIAFGDDSDAPQGAPPLN